MFKKANAFVSHLKCTTFKKTIIFQNNPNPDHISTCSVHGLARGDNVFTDNCYSDSSYRGIYLLVCLQEKPVTARGWAR